MVLHDLLVPALLLNVLLQVLYCVLQGVGQPRQPLVVIDQLQYLPAIRAVSLHHIFFEAGDSLILLVELI